MPENMKVAAAYIRVSTDEQVELSPDSQKEQIFDYARRNGITVPEEYIFIEGEKKKGLSGRKAANRPKFQKMIALAKANPKPFDCILVWKFSRFARNIDESTYYKSILRKKCGVDVISISEPIMEGMYGRLIEMIIEWSDEFYSFNLATEVKRGMSAKARAGEFCSYAPMGYKMVDKKLVVDNNLAPLVKNIFKEYADGGAVRQMAIKLNERGIRTKFGNPIENRFITYMISNPLYKGYIALSTNGKRKREDIADSEKVIYQKGIHEPIVDDELWQRCYDRFLSEKRKNKKEANEQDYALRTLIKCGNCGATLTHSTGGRLQCNKYNRGICTVSHSLDATAAEMAVIDKIRADAAAMSKNEFISGNTIIPDVINLLKSYDEKSNIEKNQALMGIIEKVVANKTLDGYELEVFYKKL